MTHILLFFLFTAILIIALFRKTQTLKKKARRCAEGAKVFHEKLQRLASPSHFFTDEEARQLKMEFDPLLFDVNKLYDSVFISKSYLDNLGLSDFLDERKLINHIQMKNNQVFRPDTTDTGEN